MDLPFLKFIGMNDKFVGNEESSFLNFYEQGIEISKGLIEQIGFHTPMAYVIMTNGELYAVQLDYFQSKDQAAHVLKACASFPLAYGIITVLESWIKSFDKNDPAAEEFLNGNKSISQSDDKKEALIITAETVKGYKRMVTVPLIRTSENKVITGPQETMDDVISGRFCNLFEKRKISDILPPVCMN